jgi:hypothetical protein
MEYKRPEEDFVRRTLALVRQYDEHVRPFVPEAEQFEETLLINCLVGLLVLPKERWQQRIANLQSHDLADLGLPPTVVDSWGTCRDCGREPERSIREFLRRVRNAVCHVRIEPRSSEGRITGWHFTDRNGFAATVPADLLRAFVAGLAERMLAGKT